MLHGIDDTIKSELHVNQQRMTSRQKQENNHYHLHDYFVENNDEYVGHSKTNILSKAVKLKESSSNKGLV